MNTFSINTKALNKSRCLFLVITIIILFIIACTLTIFLLIKIDSLVGRLKTKEVVFIAAIIGIIDFFISALIGRLVSKKVCMNFNDNNISIIYTKNTINISYSEIEKVLIINDTDYSRIKFFLKNKKTHTFYIGICYMMQGKKQIILENKNILDDFFYNFKKEIGGRNGLNSINYYS